MNNFITVQGELVKKRFNPQTNSTEIDLSKKYIYIPCSSITEDEALINLVKRVSEQDPRLFLCPYFKQVDNDVTISSDPENLSSTYLNIKVYPCSLPDRNECYPITKVFGAQTNIVDMSNLLSPSNYEDPVVFRWIGYRYLMDLTRTKSFRYTLQQNTIIDDRHFFKKAEIKAEYAIFKPTASDTWARDMTQLYCTKAMINAGECEEYMEFVYEMNNEVVITTRRYKKIPQLVGEFGGVLKLLTTVFVILSLYYRKAIKSFLFEKVFLIEKSTLVEAKNALESGEDKASQAQDRGEKNPNQKEGGVEVGLSEVNEQADSQGLIRQKQKKSEKNNTDSKLNKMLEEVVDSKVDVVELVKKMALVEIFKKASLKKHYQILLPLVLLKAKKSEKAQIEKSSTEKNILPQTQIDQDSSKAQIQRQLTPEGPEDESPNFNKKPHNNRPQLSSYRKIYQELRKLNPNNCLEKMCSDAILSYLSLVFEAA